MRRAAGAFDLGRNWSLTLELRERHQLVTHGGLAGSSAPMLAGVTALLVGVGLLASYVPARHATRISPTDALRAE